jgi:hypothetical protein
MADGRLRRRDIAALIGNVEPDTCYLAGRLHDIGKPVLAAMILEVDRKLGRATPGWSDLTGWTRSSRARTARSASRSSAGRQGHRSDAARCQSMSVEAIGALRSCPVPGSRPGPAPDRHVSVTTMPVDPWRTIGTFTAVPLCSGQYQNKT